MTTERSTACNSTFAIGGVSCSADSFVVTESSVLRINISGEKPAHRKCANRYLQASQTIAHMTKIILTIAVLLFNGMTFSETTKETNYTLTIKKGKIIKENKRTYWLTPTTLTNNTKDTLRYFSMSCSWQDFYSVDNNKLQVVGTSACYKNGPKILTLAPKQSSTVEIKLLISQTIDASEIKFRIGFNLMKTSSTQKILDFHYNEVLKKRNVIWSNIISM